MCEEKLHNHTCKFTHGFRAKVKKKSFVCIYKYIYFHFKPHIVYKFIYLNMYPKSRIKFTRTKIQNFKTNKLILCGFQPSQYVYIQRQMYTQNGNEKEWNIYIRTKVNLIYIRKQEKRDLIKKNKKIRIFMLKIKKLYYTNEDYM